MVYNIEGCYKICIINIIKTNKTDTLSKTTQKYKKITQLGRFILDNGTLKIYLLCRATVYE